MLMDHADAEGDRVVRILDRDRLAVDQDLAAVGVIKAIRDPHDRRFAGTVLANDGVDRALLDRHRNVVIRDDIAEGFCDVSEFEHFYFAIASVTLISPAMIFAFASSVFWITSSGMRSLLLSSIAYATPSLSRPKT